MYGQKSFNDYAKFYPIGDDPNIRFITSYVKQEDILFEANPVLKLSFYNNFVKGLINEDKHTQAWYISFKPQIRMYTDNSLPIKTPSYRIFLGTQHLFNLPTNNDASMKFWGLLLESGHYSNGQSDCVFSEDFSDGSIDCENIYKTINSSTNLSEILNRRSGNFSTNLTKLILNYRTYLLDEDYFPKQSHSVNLGYTLYHNKFLGIGDFGGFTNDDIAIYGSSRFMVAYEFMRVFKKNIKKRYTLKQKITYINNAHSSVEPFRLESIFSMYPFSKSKSLGFTFSYIYGHDNYNYRFVDSGQQVSIGITWSQFPAITLKSL
jgi:hypothetical protein